MFHVYRIRKDVPGIGRKIAKALGAQEITSGLPKYGVKEEDIVINYGRSKIPDWEFNGVNILNHPNSVGLAVDKIKTLEILTDLQIPTLKFYTSREDAKEANTSLLVRTTVFGKQGNGILFVKNGESIPEAPLYTEFFDKTHEFRIHVFKGKVIDIVQKKRMGKKKLAKRNLEEPDPLLRNHKRGWIFGRKNIYVGEDLQDLATSAIQALNLDFGGVDILVKMDTLEKETNQSKLIEAVVCEVNSAPGMSSPTTFNAYIESFKLYEDEK